MKRWVLTALAASMGSGCLEDLGPIEPSPMPPRVATAFDRSCASQQGCHGQGATQPSLTRDAAPDLLTADRDYIVAGDLAASIIAQRILHDVSPMPPVTVERTEELEGDLFVILGFIASLDPSDGGESDGGTGSTTM